MHVVWGSGGEAEPDQGEGDAQGEGIDDAAQRYLQLVGVSLSAGWG